MSDTPAITAVCPKCGRTVKTHLTRFQDRVYNSHKLATASDRAGRPTEATKADLTGPQNRSASYTYELDCPNSGQVVEDSELDTPPTETQYGNK